MVIRGEIDSQQVSHEVHICIIVLATCNAFFYMCIVQSFAHLQYLISPPPPPCFFIAMMADLVGNRTERAWQSEPLCYH